MNFKSTALLIGSVVASVSSIAQPVLMTELSKGDTWFSADISKVSSKSNYKGEIFNGSSKQNTDIFDVTAISVASNKQSFTPFLAASFQKYTSGALKTSVKSAYTGGLFDLDENRKAFVLIGYNKSDDKDLIRNSAIATLAFEMSEPESQLKNELSLNGQFLVKNDYVHGGHSFEIVNRSKITINSKVDFTASIGFKLATELTFNEVNTLNNNSMYSFGGDLNFHPSNNFTIQFSMLRTSIDSVEKSLGVETNTDTDATITSMSLINRF